MTTRLVSIALALLLLVTQPLGLHHLVAHGLQGAAGPARAGAAASPHDAPAHDDAAADGLCQACLAFVVLGTATPTALAAWAPVASGHPLPAGPAIAPWPRRAGTPYLARAPPPRA